MQIFIFGLSHGSHRSSFCHPVASLSPIRTGDGREIRFCWQVREWKRRQNADKKGQWRRKRLNNSRVLFVSWGKGGGNDLGWMLNWKMISGRIYAWMETAKWSKAIWLKSHNLWTISPEAKPGSWRCLGLAKFFKTQSNRKHLHKN